VALTRVCPLILFAAFWCHAAQPGAIPSDAAKVPPAQAQGFLEMICPGHASATGCSVCPAGTPFSGAPSWDLQAIIFGHFLKPASEDALVSGMGCEPHTNGFNGAYLFTREGSSWRKVWYAAAENASDCKKLTGSDGRDLLVCEGADMHQGVGDWFLYLLDAGQDPSQRKDDTLDIFFGLDDSLGGCTQLPDGTVVSGAIESVSFSPAKASHAMRITVTARLGKAAIPAKIMSDCDQSNGKILPTIATVRRRYEFLFNGRKVVPDAKNPPTDRAWAVAPLTSYRAGK
jgi:hypothetical protein